MQVWDVLGAYFTHVGCHGNPDISKYAIDSLRQLSIKFLEKPELPNYGEAFVCISASSAFFRQLRMTNLRLNSAS
jgi:Sec7-like guanine-nucleotide exchange factor